MIRAPQFFARVIAWVYGLPEPPGVMAFGGAILQFQHEPVPFQLMLHESIHIAQAARCAPAWLPDRLRPWIGAPLFWWRYWREHRRNGYAGNAFEIEARQLSGAS